MIRKSIIIVLYCSLLSATPSFDVNNFQVETIQVNGLRLIRYISLKGPIVGYQDCHKHAEHLKKCLNEHTQYSSQCHVEEDSIVSVRTSRPGFRVFFSVYYYLKLIGTQDDINNLLQELFEECSFVAKNQSFSTPYLFICGP